MKNPLAEDIAELFAGTDWELLREQKETLARLELQYRLRPGDEAEHLSGIIYWIDSLQDIAEKAGCPVVFNDEEESMGVGRG